MSDLQRAGQTVIAFRHAVQECNLDRIAAFIKEIIEKELWRARAEGVPDRLYKCESLPEFITAKPIRGCGWPLDKITLLLRQAGNEKVLYMWRKATKGGKGRPPKNSDRVTIKSKRGNSKDYLLDRLEQERPDLFERVINKELATKTAAREAGLIKEPTPLELLQKAWKKASAQERQTFLKEINP